MLKNITSIQIGRVAHGLRTTLP